MATLTFGMLNTENRSAHLYDIELGENFYNHSRDWISDEKYIAFLKSHLTLYDGTSFKIDKKRSFRIDVKKVDGKAEHFSIAFRHSEQLLFNWLLNPDTIKSIVTKLLDKLSDNIENYTVKAAILNIYSDNYMCENCQAIALAFQKKREFLGLLEQALEDSRFYLTKANLTFTIIVSAITPLVPKAQQNNIDEYRFKDDDHKNFKVDLALLKGDHLFFKDVSRNKVNISGFFSRYEKKASEFQNTIKKLTQLNSTLKKETHDLEEENKRLRQLLESKEEHKPNKKPKIS